MENVLNELSQRGLLEAKTDPSLDSYLSQSRGVYCGFDPTSDSLHLGNLVAIMGLYWFQKYGHKPYALVGGATALIGDPSGRSSERPELDLETVFANEKGILENLKATLSFFGLNKAELVNNYSWFSKMNTLTFLRDVGRFFRLGPMLGKESVKARMQSDEGMSYTEFSYALLQSYDFLKLFLEENVTLQLGGSDQWGNITSGIDLIRKISGKTAYGVTFPLLVKSDGQKFGKSQEGAIWLSPKKLSSYDFYQYLYRVSDDDVIKLLKMLTTLPIEEIKKIEKKHLAKEASPGYAQSILAKELTMWLHEEKGLLDALSATSAISPGSSASLTKENIEHLLSVLPVLECSYEEFSGKSLVDLLVQAGLMESKSAARRLIEQGGVYLNNERLNEVKNLSKEDLIEGGFALLSCGKKKKAVIRVKKSAA